MKATGIVRRIDDLGRIVIPREIRRSLRIREGDPLELYTQDGAIVFKKYSPMGSIGEQAITVFNALRETINIPCALYDRDDKLAGANNKGFPENTPDDWVEAIYDPATSVDVMYITPIISDGDKIGFISYITDKDNTSIHDSVRLAAKTISHLYNN